MLTDSAIRSLLVEPKPVVAAPEVLRDLKPEPTGSSRLASRIVQGAAGNRFGLRVRQSSLDPYDFSVILTYAPAGGPEIVLRRHNGPSHRHTNPIEKRRFQGVCHIHEATERYQRRGNDAEHYAEPTARFHDTATALACMLKDANFEPPAESPFPGL